MFELSQVMKKRREELGLTIIDLASSAGVSPGMVSGFEEGQNTGFIQVFMMLTELKMDVSLVSYDDTLPGDTVFGERVEISTK